MITRCHPNQHARSLLLYKQDRLNFKQKYESNETLQTLEKKIKPYHAIFIISLITVEHYLVKGVLRFEDAFGCYVACKSHGKFSVLRFFSIFFCILFFILFFIALWICNPLCPPCSTWNRKIKREFNRQIKILMR